MTKTLVRHNGGSEYIIESLSDAHDRAAFRCGTEALDSYLHRQARQDVERRIAAVFVMTLDGIRVDGYYTLSSLSLPGVELPPSLAKKPPSRSPIGVTLLGRMAVREDLKGQGLGEFLLLSALDRALRASREVASWAVVVDAKAEARNFYLKYEFSPLKPESHRMMLTMKTIEDFLA